MSIISIDKFYLKEVGLNNRIEDQVILLAKLCKNNGLDGVVCATNEIQVLRREIEYFGKAKEKFREELDLIN